MTEIPVKIKTLTSLATTPTKGSHFAAGYDLYAESDVIISPNEIRAVPTGLAFEIPQGYEIQIRSRSGLASKGIVVANSPGTIDADYRGEVKVLLHNTRDEPFTVYRKDRIAQMLIKPVYDMNFTIVEDISDTERGTGGFGSTGI